MNKKNLIDLIVCSICGCMFYIYRTRQRAGRVIGVLWHSVFGVFDTGSVGFLGNQTEEKEKREVHTGNITVRRRRK